MRAEEKLTPPEKAIESYNTLKEQADQLRVQRDEAHTAWAALDAEVDALEEKREGAFEKLSSIDFDINQKDATIKRAKRDMEIANQAQQILTDIRANASFLKEGQRLIVSSAGHIGVLEGISPERRIVHNLHNKQNCVALYKGDGRWAESDYSWAEVD